MSSHFGNILRLTTFGESHGKSVGGVLDGCPPNVSLTEADIQAQLNRRRPGQSHLTTDREELDTVTIVSGVEGGRTLGTPIAFYVAIGTRNLGIMKSSEKHPDRPMLILHIRQNTARDPSVVVVDPVPGKPLHVWQVVPSPKEFSWNRQVWKLSPG